MLRTSTGRDATGRRGNVNLRFTRELNGKRNAPTDENFFGAMHISHQLALLQGHANVFFSKQCGAVNAGGTQRLLKSQCDGTGES